MALTPLQYQMLIISELNSTAEQINRLRERGELPRFESEDFAAVVEAGWQMHAERGIASSYLQYFYAKRQAIIWLQGQVWDDVTWQDADANEAAGQAFQALQAMEQAITTELRLYEQRRAAGTVLAGALTTVTPTVGVCGAPNPFNPAYTGDPRRRWPYYP